MILIIPLRDVLNNWTASEMDIEKLIAQKDQHLRNEIELQSSKVDRQRLLLAERSQRWKRALPGVEKVLRESADKNGFSFQWIEKLESGGRVQFMRRTEFRPISLEIMLRMDERVYAMDLINELVMTSHSAKLIEDRFSELIDLDHLAVRVEAAIMRAV